MKKIIGYILLAIGGFIALTLLTQLPKTIKALSNTSETYSGGNETAYIAGAITAFVMMLIVAFLGIFFGLRLLKKDRKQTLTTKEVEDVSKL
ncbi:hypothetical protein [Kordia sp.]|uniref:hypothetical protein n=1 Tax=Kordia sp. TaxID=1965332 RepID=UPI003B5ABAE7